MPPVTRDARSDEENDQVRDLLRPSGISLGVVGDGMVECATASLMICITLGRVLLGPLYPRRPTSDQTGPMPDLCQIRTYVEY